MNGHTLSVCHTLTLRSSAPNAMIEQILLVAMEPKCILTDITTRKSISLETYTGLQHFGVPQECGDYTQ
jgi:hypothetical protein